jgi:(1->4)-alpha-D-glucan 1-alpha-D-glucosylmutase
MNRGKKSIVRGEEMPDRNDEYFLYQTLLGGFPLNQRDQANFLERLKAYIIKSVREAKVHTEWLKPDLAYEEAYLRFVEAILDPAQGNPFPGELAAATEKIAFYGMMNSLSRTFLKMVAPGVPDFYQGTELWDLSFVDPDNRRPVDYECRRVMLNKIKARESENSFDLLDELLSTWKDGRVKLYLTYKALNFRRQYKDIFLQGEYLPLEVVGDLQEHACAFARQRGAEWVVAVVPRLVAGIATVGSVGAFAQLWGSAVVALPDAAPRHWRNVLTGERVANDVGGARNGVALRELFSRFPAALLYSGSAAETTFRVEPKVSGEVRGEQLYR